MQLDGEAAIAEMRPKADALYLVTELFHRFSTFLVESLILFYRK